MRARLRRLAGDDRGASLMELVVGMAVMTVFMVIFTAGMIVLTRTTTQVEAISSSTAQANSAFLRLDKLVRYASAVTTPDRGTGGDWYVELADADPADGTPRCVQLRVDAHDHDLAQRTWSLTKSPAGPFGWEPLADDVLNGAAAAGSADQPFTTPSSTVGSSSLQRLTVSLVTGTSGPASDSTTRTSLTFTALNSNASDRDAATRCTQPPGSEVYRP